MAFFKSKAPDDESLPITETTNALKPQPTASSKLEQPQTKQPQKPDGRSKKSSSPRPDMLRRTTSVQTQYMDMLLGMDQIPRLHNILASFFTYILLAGFIVFPGTFTSLEDYKDTNTATSGIEKKLVNTVAHVPLLWIAGTCCVIGGVGMILLWYRWRDNYVWLINRIFM